MPLSNGHPYLAIPGPSVIPDEVLQAMHHGSPNIYAGPMVEMAYSLVPDLKSVARTAGNVAMYIGNGHAAWEAALANTLNPGDKVLVLATGRFGYGWADMVRGLGAVPVIEDFGNDQDIDLNRVEEILRADTAHELKAVLAVHVDTATSVRSDIKGLREAITATGHPALYMVDCIASLGCDEFLMDDWGVDVMVAACQKGLMTPPGMCFVYFNEKAEAARAGVERVSYYWDWVPRADPSDGPYQLWAGTPPTSHLYGLRVALDMMAAEGMEAIWARHSALASSVWAAADRWSEGGPLRLNVAEASKRSNAVTSIGLDAGQGDALRQWTEEQAGVTLGIGLGRDPASAWFRIGHMGHVNAHMVLGVLGVIDAGLKSLDIPHGSGAIEAAVKQVL